VALFHDPSTPFSLTIGRQDSVATVAVVGELDIATAPRLSAAFDAHGDADLLVVDLTAATFIDSTGVRALVEADGRNGRNGGSASRLVVRVDEGPVRRVLDLCGLDGQMAIVSGHSLRCA
jgi:anti-sigma B factor antagonist